MTKQTYTSTVLFTTDAQFQAWVTQLSNALKASGLVNTTDTGQINPATAIRPTVANTYAGYEIYRFNDPLQSSRPVFFRIEYGAGNPATSPVFRVTIGTGTDGAGNITGAWLSNSQCARNSAPTQNGVTLVTHTADGYLLIAWNIGGVSAGSSQGFFMLDRTRDDTGAATADGLYTLQFGGGGVIQGTAYAASTGNNMGSPSTALIGCLVPQKISASLVTSDPQVYRHYVSVPQRVRAVVGCCTYINSEFTAFSPFTVALVGSTVRTYMPLGSSGPVQADCQGANGQSAYTLAVLWED